MRGTDHSAPRADGQLSDVAAPPPWPTVWELSSAEAGRQPKSVLRHTAASHFLVPRTDIKGNGRIHREESPAPSLSRTELYLAPFLVFSHAETTASEGEGDPALQPKRPGVTRRKKSSLKGPEES